jgi:hypothetical protein
VYFDERAFADKVMARVSTEPTPSVAGAAVAALRRMSPSLLFGVSWTCWHLLTARTAVVRPQLRFKSAALLSVLLMTLAIGTTFAAAGAVAVVQQVAQNLPALTGPHRPNPSHAANHGGTPPFASHDPVGTRADPSAVPAGAQPPAGVGAPHASASPGDTGGDRGGGDNGNGQGDGNTGGGKGAQPSPTPGNDGQGEDNGGGGDQGDGHGSQASPSPTDDGQGDNQGGGQNSDGGDNSNGSDHSTGGRDSGSGSGGSDANSANNGDNSTNGND